MIEALFSTVICSMLKYQRVIKRAYFPVISELIKKEVPFDLNMIYPP